MDQSFGDIIRFSKRKKIVRKQGDRQSRRVAGGFAIIIALLTLSVLIFLLPALRTRLEKRYSLYAVFPTAPRLRVGAPVWIGGQAVGRVTAITFRPVQADSSASIAVRLDLPRKHQALVRGGSDVKLSAARLIGEPAVDITPGSPAESMLLPGDTIFAEPTTSRGAALVSWRHFQQSLDSLQAATRAVAPLVSARMTQYAGFMGEVEAVQQQLAGLRVDLRGSTLDRLLNDSTLQQSIAAAAHTVAQLGPTFQEATARLRDPAAQAALLRVKLRVTELNAQLDAFQRLTAQGSLPRFARDSALMMTIGKVQVALDSLVAETKSNPLRFWLGKRKNAAGTTQNDRE